MTSLSVYHPHLSHCSPSLRPSEPKQALLTLWRPTEEQQSVREGDVVLLSNFQPSKKGFAEAGPVCGEAGRQLLLELTPAGGKARGR